MTKNHLYVESNKKNDTNEFTCKTETDSQAQKTKLWLPKGKEREVYVRSLGLKFIH